MVKGHKTAGRPRGFDADAALRAALDLFWRQGYLGTSVEELTCEMNIGRSSFYAAFGSKHDTLLATLRLYCAEANSRFAAAAAAAPDAQAALIALLRGIADPQGGRKGCFMLNCLAEIAEDDGDVNLVAQAQLAGLRDLVAAALRNAQRNASPEAVDHFLSFALGLINLRKFGCPADEIEALIRHAVVTIP
jgi:TetR/AcrR family transcriptional repressor of nem operon